jgi:peptidyl-prolyl cis-trans isomerase SurA
MRTLLKEKTLKFLISVLMTATVLPALAQQGGMVVDKIIVKVDNYIVLKSDLENAYLNYLSGGNTGTEEAKCGILNSLVVNKLMVAKAEIDSVVVSDEEVDSNTQQRMQAIVQNSGNSPEQLEKAYGKSMADIQTELRDQIREQLLGREMQTRITKDITITPSEVRKFYAKIPTDSLPFYSSDVEVAQMVRVAKVSATQKEETRKQLNDLRARIIAGENFNELANKYSEDPSAKYNSGEMGYVSRGAMVPTYEAMAFRLRKGEISEPFESPFGFHIMQLIERRGNEYNSRHILLSASPSPKDVELTRQFLDSIRLEVKKGSIKFEEAAREYSDDAATKGRGGYFTDQDGGAKVSIRDLDPVVYFAVDSMKVGDISRPMDYRTEDGKAATRIIYFKAKIPPHAANLKDDWNRIQAAALAEKKDKVLEKWFVKARKDVFINVDPTYKGCGILE